MFKHCLLSLHWWQGNPENCVHYLIFQTQNSSAVWESLRAVRHPRGLGLGHTGPTKALMGARWATRVTQRLWVTTLGNWVPSVCHRKKHWSWNQSFSKRPAVVVIYIVLLRLVSSGIKVLKWHERMAINQTSLPFSQAFNKGRCYWGIGNMMVKFPRERRVQGIA